MKHIHLCKICNPTLEGNGYCAEHSSSGTAYNCFSFKKEIMEECGDDKGFEEGKTDNSPEDIEY